MELLANTYLPGDQRLVDKIVYELKSQGIFDEFRKECIADVDTKPAYQNLRQRVEGNVENFLRGQRWRPDMNKNQVREMVRKNINESGFLDTGVERIVDQVVNPKINTVFLLKVEELVYTYLGIEKPTTSSGPGNAKIPNISNNVDGVEEDSNSDRMDEDESPPFEPLDGVAMTEDDCSTIESHSQDSSNHSMTMKPVTADFQLLLRNSDVVSQTRHQHQSRRSSEQRYRRERDSRSRHRRHHDDDRSKTSRHSGRSHHRHHHRSRERDKSSKKPKDDHYSSKERSRNHNDRHSTDRDSNDGHQFTKSRSQHHDSHTTNDKTTKSTNNSHTNYTNGNNSNNNNNSAKEQESVIVTEESRKNGALKLPVTVISQVNWDEMEAKLQMEIDEDVHFFPSSSIKAEQNEFLQFTTKYLGALQSAIEKPQNSSEVKGGTTTGSSSDTIDSAGREGVTVHNVDQMSAETSSICQSDKMTTDTTPTPTTIMLNNEKDLMSCQNFTLPLSPAPSDHSNGSKKDDSTVVLTPILKRSFLQKVALQRYSSDDLYKPRSTFGSQRRRMSNKNQIE